MSDIVKVNRLYPCGCRDWEHVIFGGKCPPPPGPRGCCGILDISENLTTGICVNGNCVEWFCAGCGVFEKSSMGPMGPVGCGCDDLPSWGRRYPEQRPKRHVPNGARYRRRVKVRAKR